MSDIDKKMVLHALLWGLYLAAAQILINLLVYIFDIKIFSFVFMGVSFLISVVLIAFFMAFAGVTFRDKYLGKSISFLKCWIIGLIVGLTAVLISTLYTLVFNFLLVPDYLPEQMEKFIEMMSKLSIPDEQLEQMIVDMEERMTPAKMLVQTLTTSAVITFFMSLIATLFVRKKEKVQEQIY
jgi:hypothetical protein